MLKVSRSGNTYQVTEVTDLEEIQSVIDGTMDANTPAIYLHDKNDEMEFAELGEKTIDNILDQLEANGLLSVLDDAYDGVSEETKTEDYVSPRDTEGKSSEVTSLVGQPLDDLMEENSVMSKEDKIEILQAAGADLIDAVLEVREEARLMAETLDEILDPTDHKARNAMGRLLEAVGADFTGAAVEGDDAMVDFNFQQMQIDRITEALMWAASSIVENG